MLVIDFDPDRPSEHGQFHVRLIDARSGDYGIDAPRQSQLGYWCDIEHLRSGVLAAVDAAIKRYEVRDNQCEYEIRYIESGGWRSHEHVRCTGVKGHSGPHQVPEDVWSYIDDASAEDA